jgi:hypothetical protein
MWMTSNSRAERPFGRVAVLALLAALAGCQGRRDELPPDAPRPARDPAIYEQYDPPAAPMNQDRPVELRSVDVARVRGDSMLERMAGPALRKARNPLAIVVMTAEPLGDVAVNALPAVFLNGVRLGDTWPLPPDRLVLVLADAKALRAPVQVTVEWLGRGVLTRTTRPLTITEEQLRPYR